MCDFISLSFYLSIHLGLFISICVSLGTSRGIIIIIIICLVLSEAFTDLTKRVWIQSRPETNLFNGSQSNSSRETSWDCPRGI